MAKIQNDLSGRPKNVSSQEYNRYALLRLMALGTSGLAIICFIASVFNLTVIPVVKRTGPPSLTIDEALKYQGETSAARTFQGQLIAEQPIIMPDDPNLPVVMGQLKIEARSRNPQDLEPAVLFQWQERAQAIYLEQNGKRLPFKLDLSLLPLQEDPTLPTNVIWEGDTTGVINAIAVEYRGKQYPLPQSLLSDSESPLVTITRNYVVNGQKVVVVAGLETTDQGPQIVPPVDSKAKVRLGHQSKRPTQGRGIRVMLFLVGVSSAFACYVIIGKYRQAKAEIIRKSNQIGSLSLKIKQ